MPDTGFDRYWPRSTVAFRGTSQRLGYQRPDPTTRLPCRLCTCQSLDERRSACRFDRRLARQGEKRQGSSRGALILAVDDVEVAF